MISPLRGPGQPGDRPLRPPRIGVWGRAAGPGEAVYSVRQNLQPLVLNGQPTAAAADWGRGGQHSAAAQYVARSALGQDASGDSSTPPACPRSPPTSRTRWSTAERGSRWNSTSTPSGYS